LSYLLQTIHLKRHDCAVKLTHRHSRSTEVHDSSKVKLEDAPFKNKDAFMQDMWR